MKDRYQLNFESRNSGQSFTLSFRIQGGRYFHLLQDVQVYQKLGDLFCSVTQYGSPCNPWRYKVATIFEDHHFNIQIETTPDGASVYIHESVIMQITAESNLQPYGI